MTVDYDYDAIVNNGDEDDPARGGGYRPEPFWSIKEGESATLRFLQESAEWPMALTHSFFPVAKAAPEGHEGKWPEFMSASCRKDEGLARLYPDGCPICKTPGTNKFGKTWEKAAQVFRYTLAVERETVQDENGNRITQDKTVKIPVFGDDGKPIEGQEIEVPSIVIVNNTMFAMFSQLKAIGQSYKTLRGCDFQISRIKNPNGNGTIYQIIPVLEQSGILPGTDHWKLYTDTVSLWVPGGLRLKQIIGEKSSEKFYDKFFTTNGVVLPKPAPGSAQAGLPATAAAPPTANANALAAMRDRIAKQTQPAAAPADAVPATS